MLAPLATLAFLATLWLVVVTMAGMFGTSGSRIAAALRGNSPLAVIAPQLRPAPVRISQRARPIRVLRAQPRLRAAA